jgi:hypothetical protein
MYNNDMKYKVDTNTIIDEQDIEDVLEKICNLCHEGISEISLTYQEIEDNPYLDNKKTWKEQCESIREILCRILNELGD